MTQIKQNFKVFTQIPSKRHCFHKNTRPSYENQPQSFPRHNPESNPLPFPTLNYTAEESKSQHAIQNQNHTRRERNSKHQIKRGDEKLQDNWTMDEDAKMDQLSREELRLPENFFLGGGDQDKLRTLLDPLKLKAIL